MIKNLNKVVRKCRLSGTFFFFLGLEIRIPDHVKFTNQGGLLRAAASSRNLRYYTFKQQSLIDEKYISDYSSLVRNLWGGMSMWNGDITWDQFVYNRCADPRNIYLEPGDIVVRSNTFTNTNEYNQLVYLGDGKYLSYDKASGTYPIVNEREFFRSLFYKIFYVVRPTLLEEPPYSKGMEKEQSHSLNLNDNVVLNYYLEVPSEKYTNAIAKVNGKEVEMTKEDGGWHVALNNAAKEMGKQNTVQVTATDEEGETYYGKEYTVSIRDYAEQMLGMLDWSLGSDAMLGRTMIGMLNYGTESQKYFGHETSDLANKNLTSADQEKMTVYTADKLSEFRGKNLKNLKKDDPKGLYYASSCVLGSSQALRFYLHLPEAKVDREDLSYSVTYRNYRGKSHTVKRSFENLASTTTTDVFYFEVPDMAAADVETRVTLTVKQGDKTILSVTDSIAGYCARAYDRYESVHALADSMLVYGLSARDYFYDIYEPTLGREENEMPVY